MDKIRVLFDADGVLLNTIGSFIPVIEAVTGKRYEPHHFTTYDIFEFVGREHELECNRRFARPGFCLEMEPYREAVEYLPEIQKLAEVYIVTSPYASPTWESERRINLKHHLGIHPDRVVQTAAKHVVHGRVLVEDTPRNLVTWLEDKPTSHGILLDQPYNRNPVLHDQIVRAMTWDELFKLIKQAAEGQERIG